MILKFFGLGKAAVVDSGKTWRHTRGYTFDVVGEGAYQKNLSKICGGKKEYGVKLECVALLITETGEHGEAVRVDINGRTVGYLSRDHVTDYYSVLSKNGLSDESVSVRAKVVGGWKRYSYDEENDSEDINEGHFGVKLNMRWPPELLSE